MCIRDRSKKKQSSTCQETSPRSNSKGHSTTVCKWAITKHLLNTRPKCPACHAEITKDDLKITCDARWTPPHKNKEGQSFTVPRTFHYCLKWACVSGNPHVTAPSQSLQVYFMWILLQISPQMSGEGLLF